MARNCGECLMDAVEIVELDKDGKCPRCGAAYGPDCTCGAPFREPAKHATGCPYRQFVKVD